MGSESSYQQASKGQVRRRVLTAAVTLLTRGRSRTAIIHPRHVEETLRYALGLLKNKIIAAEALAELEAWAVLHRRLVGRKLPRDLKVLFLCGPEPLNDLQVLLAEGVDPHNIWAVESEPEEFERATSQVGESGLPVKLYPGDLAGFLEFNSELFDIIYFDGCAPLGSGRPNSLFTLLQLFKHQRLAPLGVLVTTFAGIDDSLLRWYADVLAAFFRYRYNDVPEALFKSGLDPADFLYDDGALRNAIRSQPEPYYSDFVTRFITDLARSIVPNCRAFAFGGVERTYLAGRSERVAALDAAFRVPSYKGGMSIRDILFGIGDFLQNPGGYPVLSFLRTLAERSAETPFWKQLNQTKLGSHSLLEGAQFAALLENCVEGHWKAMGSVLFDAVRHGWFDKNMGLSCDVPFPNLMVNSLLGIHGAPAFPNPKVSQRFRYVAKQTPMYTDLIVLDRCRSYYDWFPTAHMALTRFQSKGFQLVARCILDRIGWADWHSKSHPFHGAAMAGMGATKHARAVTFAPRVLVD